MRKHAKEDAVGRLGLQAGLGTSKQQKEVGLRVKIQKSLNNFFTASPLEHPVVDNGNPQIL
jgi:hypothetical protein